MTCGRIAADLLEGFLAVGRLADVELADLAQPVDQDPTIVLVVLDDENLLARHRDQLPCRAGESTPDSSMQAGARGHKPYHRAGRVAGREV